MVGRPGRPSLLSRGRRLLRGFVPRLLRRDSELNIDGLTRADLLTAERLHHGQLQPDGSTRFLNTTIDGRSFRSPSPTGIVYCDVRSSWPGPGAPFGLQFVESWAAAAYVYLFIIIGSGMILSGESASSRGGGIALLALGVFLLAFGLLFGLLRRKAFVSVSFAMEGDLRRVFAQILVADGRSDEMVHPAPPMPDIR